MQKLRKCLAAVLVAVMMLSLGSGMVNTEAQAATMGTITVNKAVDKATYKAYRIFDATVAGDNAHASYELNTDWIEFFTTGDGASYLIDDAKGQNLNKITVQGQTKYINLNEGNVQDFAGKAQKYAKGKSPVKTAVASGQTATFTDMPVGYYLVFAPDATQPNNTQYSSVCNLTTTHPDATIDAKGTTPSIEKTVDDPDKTVEIGQVVEYTVKGTVPNTSGYDTYTYKVKDTMTGLELTGDYDVTIDGVGSIKDGGHISGTLPKDQAKSFELGIDMTQYQAHIGKTVTITYKARVTKDAVTGQDGNANKAELVYSNDPQDPSHTVTTPPSVVKVKTFDITILKHEKDKEGTVLKDAKFVLYKYDADAHTKMYYHYDEATNVVSWVKLGENGVAADLATAIKNGKITEVITGLDGKAKFNGLAAGDYYLQETQAPDGYNLMEKDQKVTIVEGTTPKDNLVKVPNASGPVLPGTGGIGNTIFYIVGGALMLAGVVLLMRKRAK